MAWGANKFTKKLLRPWAVNNNELADFISRVPDNEEMVSQQQLFSGMVRGIYARHALLLVGMCQKLGVKLCDLETYITATNIIQVDNVTCELTDIQ